MNLIAIFCFAACGLVPNLAAQSYDITELGTLSATPSDEVRSGDINNLGFVHGENDKSGTVPGTQQTRAFVWDGVTQLEVFPTFTGTTFKGRMNDLGQCVGYQPAMVGGSIELHGYLWDSINGTSDLDFGLRGFTRCYDINNSEVIIGVFTSETILNSRYQYRGFIYDSKINLFYELPTLGGRESKAIAINDDNYVVGTTYDASGTQLGFLWKPLGGMVAIHGMRQPQDISDSSVVVGYDIDASGLVQPYSYDTHSGVLSALPLPSGYTSGAANGNNSNGQAVGYGKDSGGVQHALLWEDLNTVTVIASHVNNGGAWSITGANNINELGEISGTGLINNARRAYKLSPVLAQSIISKFLPGRSGQANKLFALGFAPHANVSLWYGGRGSGFDYAISMLITTVAADASGRAEFELSLPRRLAGWNIWLMASDANFLNQSVTLQQLIN